MTNLPQRHDGAPVDYDVAQVAARRDDFEPVRRLARGLGNALAFVVVLAAFVGAWVATGS